MAVSDDDKQVIRIEERVEVVMQVVTEPAAAAMVEEPSIPGSDVSIACSRNTEIRFGHYVGRKSSRTRSSWTFLATQCSKTLSKVTVDISSDG